MTGDLSIEPPPGTTVGAYRLFDVIAHGDVGTVYRAEDSSSGARVALKLLSSEIASTPTVMHRVRRETKNAIKLANPYVARVLDCGDYEGRFFIVREWLDGHPLSVALVEEGPLPVERAATIGNQICIALGLIHRVGLFHRDLKPNHVFLASDPGTGAWMVKLIDIGIAARVTGVETNREIFGTPAYLSPEQAEGKLVNFRTDLYALGCIFIEMLTGAPPFAGTPQQLKDQHQSRPPTNVRQVRGDVAEPFAQLINKLLSKQAAARPISAAMVQRELERAVPACKGQLAPVVTGRGGVASSTRPPASSAPAPVVQAPAPAPPSPSPPANEDLGMAATLFGGNLGPDMIPSLGGPSVQPSPQAPAPIPPPNLPPPQIQLPPPARYTPAPPPLSQKPSSPPSSRYTPPPASQYPAPSGSPSPIPGLPESSPTPVQQSVPVQQSTPARVMQSPVQQPIAAQAPQPTPAQATGFVPGSGVKPGAKKTILGLPVVTADQLAAAKGSAPPSVQGAYQGAPPGAYQAPQTGQPGYAQTPQYQPQPQYGGPPGDQGRQQSPQKMAATVVVDGSDPAALQMVQAYGQQQQYQQGPAMYPQGGPVSNEMPTTDELRREFKKGSGGKIVIIIVVVVLLIIALAVALGFASCLLGSPREQETSFWSQPPVPLTETAPKIGRSDGMVRRS